MINSILSGVANRTLKRRLLAAVMAMLLPLVCQAALILDVGTHIDVSAANPTITLSLHNDGSGPLVIGGADLFFMIQAGGPTVDASGNPLLSLNLLTGTIFGNGAYGQTPYGSPFGPQNQGWGLFNLTGNNFATIDADQTVSLGTLTFNSFPAIGTYSLDFSGTQFYDQIGGGINPFTLNNGSLTVVPEPVQVAIPIFAGLVLVAGGLRRWYRRRADG